jgi:hypothetical protein
MIVVLVLVVLIARVSGAGDKTAQAVDPPAAPLSDRCLDVPQNLVNDMATGLAVRGGRLLNAQAVRSKDFKRVYFISAEIDGPGLEGSGEIGTWAKGGPLQDGGFSRSMASRTSCRTGATAERRTST